jgi:hypothetical protein
MGYRQNIKSTRSGEVFTADLFVQAHGSTPEDKAKFANHFVRFVEQGFPERLWTKSFYQRLSNTFGHIAHFDIHGFWCVWFENTFKQIQFLERTLAWPCYGDAGFTYSDVERAIIEWLREHPQHLEALRAEAAGQVERAERAQLARLTAKYGPG